MNFNDPCLQHIPRDFDISFEGLSIDNQQIESVEDFAESDGLFFLDKINENILDNLKNCVSIRKAFVPSSGQVLLSADYCQLELRIIANLCKDETLIKIFNEKDKDVFVLLASKWLNLPSTEIDEEKRQNVKKVRKKSSFKNNFLEKFNSIKFQ